MIGVTTDEYGEIYTRCPACGDWVDYCQGHGEIGDPVGALILTMHDDGDHTMCAGDDCEEA